MNDFDRDIQNKALSFEWGSAVAGKVLVKRHERKKRNRIILLAAMPLFLLGAGFFYQLNQGMILKSTINFRRRLGILGLRIRLRQKRYRRSCF